VPTTFLILTDHDRAGYNMAEHVERVVDGNGEDDYPGLVNLVCEKLRLVVPPLEFIRVGLNDEQVRRYQVRTRDPKSSEHDGMRNYIAECAEVDFLRSVQIEEIAREGIEDHLDAAILQRTRAAEAADIAKLRRVAEHLDTEC
jgi:hypothetical protein